MNLWSFGRVSLHLSDDEFFRITPRQYFALRDQVEAQVQHQELLTGILASTVANWSFSRPKNPLSPFDFMPSHPTRRKPKEKVNRPKPEAVASMIRLAFSNAEIVNG